MTRSHRALILQGGGALGAYEAGAVSALVKRLADEDQQNHPSVARPIFDIVAGSSIGAVNAVILVNSVIAAQRRNANLGPAQIWLDAAQALEKFWKKDVATDSWFDNPASRSTMQLWWGGATLYHEFATRYWKYLIGPYSDFLEARQDLPAYLPWYFLARPDRWPVPASGEGARRYLEYQRTLNSGTRNVLAAAIPQAADMKFLNPFTPFFWRFDNSPLLSLIQRKHWPDGKPIQTEESEPRLLLVAVDVQNCATAAAFDSYAKQEGKHYTEYGGETERHVIEYDGITPSHLLASMSTHQRYKYPAMMTRQGQSRVFWDGAYLSNTPLREVLHSHRDYWKANHDGIVPDLEVCIVNLYPAIEEAVPDEPDSIQDREIDIKFHDRTKYDLKIAEMTGDYIDLAKELLKIIKEEASEQLQDKVNSLLNTTIASKKRNGDERTYEDLLKGRFSITRKIYVERKDDRHAIYGKAFDFSGSTLRGLFDEGHKDATEAYDKSLRAAS